MRTIIAALLLFAVALASPAFAKAKKQPPLATIVEINAVAITLSVGKSGDEHQTYKITKETQIKLNGFPSTTDNLRAGMLASVVADASDPTTVKSIDARDARKH